jgi:hypothetical protein
MTPKKIVRPPATNRGLEKENPYVEQVNPHLSTHAATLNEVHPELSAIINNFLRERNIPLQLHSIRFAETSPNDFHCCVIAGTIHCGDDCP